MHIRVVTSQPWDIEADLLALPIVADHEPDDTATELDRRIEGALAAYRALGEQAGKAHAGTIIRGRETAAPWLLAMGVGDLAAFDRIAALRFGAAVERRLGGRVVRRLAIWLPATLAGGDGLDAEILAELVARGVVEGSYEPAAIYRDDVEDAPPALDELVLVVPGGDDQALTAAADRGRVIGEGANRARTLSQRASNDVSPEVLADEATAIAHAHGLEVEVIGPEQAAAMGMGMFLAVGRGSDSPPRFIVMRSGPAGATDRRGRLLAMVGKGVTFDSGGLSLKPSHRMEEMKMDKAGACTVISAIATVAALAPGLPLLAVAPAVENMPGPHSTRPGDIVRAMNGKVVEIQNTDAEGRLILGDALVYAERQGATPGGRGHADRRGRARLRQAGHRRLRDAPGLVGGSGRVRLPAGRALLADPARGRVPQGHGHVVRRAWQQQRPRGLAREERPLPQGLRHTPLGPPRYRRIGLPAPGDTVGRTWRHRRDPRHARRVGAARRLSAAESA